MYHRFSHLVVDVQGARDCAKLLSGQLKLLLTLPSLHH